MTPLFRSSGGTDGMGLETNGSAPRFQSPNTVRAIAKTQIGATSPVTTMAELFGM